MPLSIGVPLFIAVLAGALYLIGRAARRDGIMLPVVVGFIVRLTIVLSVHLVSQASGDEGFLYLDDRGYAHAGALLADLWRTGDPGHLMQPVGILPHGGPLYYHLVAGVFLMTGESVLAMKLLNVVMGTAVVLLGARLGGFVLGPGAQRRVAWMVALAPTVVWWSGPMLRDPLATFLGLAAIVAALRLPHWRAVGGTSLLLVALAFTRSTLFAAVLAGVVCWGLARAYVVRPQRLALLAGVAAILAVSCAAGLYMASGGTSTFSGVSTVTGSTFESMRDAGNTGGGGGGGGGGSESAEAPGVGDFDSELVPGSGPMRYVSVIVRFFVAPRAWAVGDVPFDWYVPLYPAMWLWYILIPAALLGAWTLRRRPEILLLGVPLLTTAAIYTYSLNSGVRQRSGIEVLVIVLIAAGVVSRRFVLISGGSVLLLLAPVAALDVGRAWVAAAVALAGATMILAGRRAARGAPPGHPPAPAAAAPRREPVGAARTH